MLNANETTTNLHDIDDETIVDYDLEDDDDTPSMDSKGRTFSEVSIHPFVQQIADEDGDAIEDGEWSNASGGEFSDEFGDELDDYPDEMFRKGWSVSSWVRNADGSDIDVVDEEEFDDYETAIERAEELADEYGVEVDERY